MVALAFSHLDIASRLTELSIALPHGEAEKLRRRLNLRDAQRLAAMWEVVFLHALQWVSPFDYEAPLQNGRTPDFALRCEVNGVGYSLVGDVTTISDDGLHDANPVKLFLTEFNRLCVKHGLDPNHFRIDFGQRQSGKFPNTRVVVALPERSDVAPLMRGSVEPYLRQLARAHTPEKTLRVSEAGVDLTLTHVQGQWSQSSGGPSYETPYSLHKNPIAPKLEGKADQMKGAPSEALRLVVVCDGGCKALKRASIGPVSVADIVGHFLRNTDHVDFVLLLSIENREPFRMHSDWVTRPTLLTAPRTLRTPRRTDASHDVVFDLLDKACRQLPKPIINMESVRNIISPGPNGKYSAGIDF